MKAQNHGRGRRQDEHTIIPGGFVYWRKQPRSEKIIVSWKDSLDAQGLAVSYRGAQLYNSRGAIPAPGGKFTRQGNKHLVVKYFLYCSVEGGIALLYHKVFGYIWHVIYPLCLFVTTDKANGSLWSLLARFWQQSLEPMGCHGSQH